MLCVYPLRIFYSNKMKQFCTFAFLAMLMPCVALAQFSISGKVTDKLSQQALAGASISNGTTSLQTDADGYFSFANLPTGIYTITVSYLGYSPYSSKINLKSNVSLSIALNPSSINTDEVMVRATRATANTPTTFKNLGKADIEKNNLGQDLPYLLNQTPSVVVSSDAGAGIGYTGIRIRGSDPTRVNVTINGIPYNDPESQGTFWVNLPDFASSVDNIQIQRGVGTSTNGAGAFGGSLNIQTTTRRDSAYAELNNSVGSFDSRKHTLNFGSGLLNGKFTLDGRLSNIVSDGYIDRGSSKLKSYFASGAYYGKKDMLRANVFGGDEKTYQVWNGVPEAKLKGNNDSLLKHFYNNLDYLYYNDTPADSLNLWNSNKRTYSQFRYDNQTDNYTQTHYQLLYNHNFSNTFTLNSALHYTKGKGYFEEYKDKQTFESYGFNPADYGLGTEAETDLIRRRWLDNDFYGLTYSLNYTPSAETNITFGGAYNEYDGDHFGEIIAAPHLQLSSMAQRYYDGRGFKKDLNFYGKIDFQVGAARIFYDFQYRYLDYSITGTDKTLTLHDERYYHKFFNPKVGLTYQIDQNSNFYTSFAIANKEPNRDDYVNAITGALPRSENLKNVEAGYRISGKGFQAGANLYGMFYKNQLIATGKINDVGEYIRQNVPDSYRLGIELDGSIRLSKALLWAANATLSRNKIKNFTEYMDDYINGGQISKAYTNTNIAYSPSFVASNQIAFQPLKYAEIALLTKYVSDQYLDNTSHSDRTLDAFLVNDLRLGYTLPLKGIKSIGATLLINNILNEKYESNGYSYTYNVGTLVTENFYFPQAGRNYLVSLNLKF